MIGQSFVSQSAQGGKTLLCVQLVWMHHGVNAIFHSTRFPRFGVLFIGLIRTPGRRPTRSAP
jgi:hypothetical protein